MEIFRVAWLAGIIDGEGSMGIYPSPHHNGRDTYITCLSINNTDALIINESQLILTELLGHTVSITSQTLNRTSHLIYRIVIRNRGDIIKLIPQIEPYLIGKKAQAQLFYKILVAHIHRTGYTKVELEAVAILKRMKTEHIDNADQNIIFPPKWF